MTQENKDLPNATDASTEITSVANNTALSSLTMAGTTALGWLSCKAFCYGGLPMISNFIPTFFSDPAIRLGLTAAIPIAVNCYWEFTNFKNERTLRPWVRPLNYTLAAVFCGLNTYIQLNSQDIEAESHHQTTLQEDIYCAPPSHPQKEPKP